MTALFHVACRPAEPADQEIAEPLLGPGEIFGRIHRTENVIGGHLPIEGPDEALKAVLPDEGINVVFVQHSHSTGEPRMLASHVHERQRGLMAKKAKKAAKRTGRTAAKRTGRTTAKRTVRKPAPRSARKSARKAAPVRRTRRPVLLNPLFAPVNGAERRDIGHVKVDVGRAGAARVKRMIYPAGFRWSVDMKPAIGSELCMHAHVGFLAHGEIHIEYPDGCIVEHRAPHIVAIEPGHDGWVVGSQPVVLIEFDFEEDTVQRLGMPDVHKH